MIAFFFKLKIKNSLQQANCKTSSIFRIYKKWSTKMNHGKQPKNSYEGKKNLLQPNVVSCY